ncbi:hypothetical protein [Phenylobacterium sp.]|jgi:hypothetical protein|uniref:hypothetical protein n=1 Tax=Phenylobacterium sp. TaxID=1871053 RepID=UPI002F9450B5
MDVNFSIDRRGLLSAGVALASSVVAGCGKFGPDPEAEAVAKQAYQHLVRGEDEALEALLLPTLRKPGTRQTFALMRGMIPKSEPTSVEQVNWRTFAGTSGRTVSFQHAYNYGSQVVTATTELKAAGGGWLLQTFNVNAAFTGAPAETPQPANASG